MSRHIVRRWLPIVALATILAACGTQERKVDPGPAGIVSGNATPGTGMGASSEGQPNAIWNPASTESQPGIRAADPRLKLNLHVFGISYHPDRAGTRDRHLDNEVNLGLGLNYELRNDPLGVLSLEAGVFKDSGRNWAKFAGVGYQFKIFDRWRLGADLLAIHSATYHEGRGFVAPIPHLSYDFGPVTLNAIYIPRVPQFNEFAVFGFYLTAPLGKW